MLKKVSMLVLFLSLTLVPLKVVANVNPALDEPVISEIYPNPPQSPETGYEFIELYNPNDAAISLNGYSLRLKGKTGTLALSGEIPAKSYKAFITPFSLTNSGATVQLYSPVTTAVPEIIIEEVAYTEVANDAQSWSRYDDMWKLATASANSVNTPQPSSQPVEEPKEYLKVEITELLPDPAPPQTDGDHEFIELYNPHSVPVDLTGYVLKAGSELDDSYVLPAISIDPLEYLAIYVSESNLGLINSTSRAAIYLPDNVLSSETQLYNEPGEGASWALINNIWQYTYLTTPSAANVYQAPPEPTAPLNGVSGVASTLQPCEAGEERNPATNRCRKINSSSATELKPCNEGEERNAATNRCRKITSAVASLSPCSAGEERNPATNRCRKVASATATSLKACDAGEERNPQTNRCRKVTASGAAGNAKVNDQGSDSQSGKPTLMNFPTHWIVGIVGAGALAYGVYEWRGELGGLAGRFGRRVLSRAT
jgi:hypothetical protein